MADEIASHKLFNSPAGSYGGAHCFLPAAYCLLFNSNILRLLKISNTDLRGQRTGYLLKSFAVDRRIIQRHRLTGVALLE